MPISFSALESDASGLYKIWPLFSKSGSNIKNHIDITIVTQSSVSNLPDVETLVNNWDGPVSVGEYLLLYSHLPTGGTKELVNFQNPMIYEFIKI